MNALFEHAVAHYADREALIDGDVRMSFAQLDAERKRAAKAFVAAGLVKSDRVAIWAPNSYEFVVAASALQSIGGVFCRRIGRRCVDRAIRD